MNSVQIEAAGGGCTAPATAFISDDWASTLGDATGKLWRATDGSVRARLRIRHPMDTGLSRDNTPAYFIERLEMKTEDGANLGTIELFEPVAEDPTLTVMPRLQPNDAGLSLEGRDNNGQTYRARIPLGGRQSRLETGSKPC